MKAVSPLSTAPVRRFRLAHPDELALTERGAGMLEAGRVPAGDPV